MPVTSPPPRSDSSHTPPGSWPAGLVLCRNSRPARIHDDPDKYIRPVKGGKFQARPFLEGKRADLGCDFATREQARKAIQDYWWGRRKELLPYTKRCRVKGVTLFLAVIPFAGRALRVGGWYATRELAHAAAVLWIRKVYRGRAEEVLARR